MFSGHRESGHSIKEVNHQVTGQRKQLILPLLLRLSFVQARLDLPKIRCI